MSNRIRKETDDVIIFDNLKSPLFWLLILAFFIGNARSNIIIILFSFIIFAFIMSLAYETVTIDKKLQSVVIENFFNNETSYFSNIKKILINIYYNKDYETGSDYKTYEIQLNTINNYNFLVYSSYSYSNALKVAEKISKITDKEISHYTTDLKASSGNQQETETISKDLHSQTLSLEQGWEIGVEGQHIDENGKSTPLIGGKLEEPKPMMREIR